MIVLHQKSENLNIKLIEFQTGARISIKLEGEIRLQKSNST